MRDKIAENHNHSPNYIIGELERSMPWSKLEQRVNRLEFLVKMMKNELDLLLEEECPKCWGANDCVEADCPVCHGTGFIKKKARLKINEKDEPKAKS